MPYSVKELIKVVSGSIKELGETFGILSKDCEAILERIKDDPKQLDYRSYVRSLFALIESILYRQKQLAKHIDNALKATTPIYSEVAGLNQFELLAIDEKNFQIMKDGSVDSTDAFIRFEQNFKFSFIVLAKSGGSDFRPIYDNCKGWDALTKTVKVRNRLMHPKNVNDLVVTPTEFRDAQRASDWFVAVFNVALQSNRAAFLKMLGILGKDEGVNTQANHVRETLPDLVKRLEELEKS